MVCSPPSHRAIICKVNSDILDFFFFIEKTVCKIKELLSKYLQHSVIPSLYTQIRTVILLSFSMYTSYILAVGGCIIILYSTTFILNIIFLCVNHTSFQKVA